MTNSKDVVSFVKSYLQDVNDILALLKERTKEAQPDESWEANIEDDGAYPEAGITEFKRHGTGIWVRYRGKYVDFNFYDLNLYSMGIENPARFITIDVGFLANYIKSIGILDESVINYDNLKKQLNEMNDIFEYVDWKFYLKDDLQFVKAM